MKDLVIYGTGGLGRVVHQLVEDLNADGAGWNCLGFLDDDDVMQCGLVHDLPVLGGGPWLQDWPSVYVVVAIGSPASRFAVVQRIATRGHERFARLIHPTAWVASRASVGRGTVILAGAVVATDCRIADHVVINMRAALGHDVALDPFVTVAPGAGIAGNSHVHQGTDIGMNASIIQGLTIGEWSVIGAGAVVVRDLPANVTAVGVPAIPIKQRPTSWFLHT